MGNGLIFALVVALWAAYFVPLALRRYDEATKSTTVDKLSALTRVVRRPQASSEDEETDVAESETAPRTTAPAGSEAGRPEPAVTLEPPRPRVNAEAHRIAARRRRRVLLTLLTAQLSTLALAAAGVLAWTYSAIPAGLIVAWLVTCRIMVRGELGLTAHVDRAPAGPAPRRRLFASVPESDTVAEGDPEDAEETVVISGEVEEVEPGRRHVMERVELRDEDLKESLNIAVPVSSMSGEALWDPLPVTVPTYVTKPRAGRTVRTVQLDDPGVWTSGHVEGEDVDFPAPSPATGAPATGRAVGE